MEKFIKGDVVVIPFPFSDLTQTKRRPALVISALEGDDVILCQITSRTIRDNYAIPLEDKDFKTGELKQSSNVRPNRKPHIHSRQPYYSLQGWQSYSQQTQRDY